MTEPTSRARELPPLPDTDYNPKATRCHSAEQMIAYAAAAVTAERERCALLVQANADACEPGSMLADCLASNAAAIRAQ